MTFPEFLQWALSNVFRWLGVLIWLAALGGAFHRITERGRDAKAAKAPNP